MSDNDRDGNPRLLTRRGFLTSLSGGVAALGVALPRVAWAQPTKGLLPPNRNLAFRSLHTGEELATTYVQHGAAVPVALDDINRILRDWRTGDVISIDPRLLDLLYVLRRELDSAAPFEVISAYRSPKTNAQLAGRSNGVAKRSMHMRGMAIDIRLPDRRLKDLHRAALGLKAGGVGLYSRSGFIHVDTGRPRRWGG